MKRRLAAIWLACIFLLPIALFTALPAAAMEWGGGTEPTLYHTALSLTPSFPRSPVVSRPSYTQASGGTASYYGSQLSADSNAAAIYSTLMQHVYGTPKPGIYLVSGFQRITGKAYSGPALAGQLPDCAAVNEVLASLDLAQSAFFNDYPDVFWLNGVSLSLSHSADYSRIESLSIVIGDNQLAEEYRNWAEPVQDQLRLDAAVQNLLNSLNLSGKEDAQKLLAIHDRLVLSISYDTSTARRIQGGGSYLSRRSFNATGALLDGLAVCDGYVKAFQLLCQQLGISCIRITGFGTGDASVIQGQDHAWSYVFLEDKWYAMDVTWDDPVGPDGTSNYPNGENLRHMYFLSGADTFHAGNHKPDATLTGSLPALSPTAYTAPASAEPPKKHIPVQNVVLSRTTHSFDASGDSEAFLLEAKVAPFDASNKALIWTSSNPTVASVSPQGLVTPLAAGEADIQVRSVDGGYSSVCRIVVPEAQPLRISPYDPAMGSVTVKAGEGEAEENPVEITVTPSQGYEVYLVTAGDTALSIPASGGSVHIRGLTSDTFVTALFSVKGSSGSVLSYAGYTGIDPTTGLVTIDGLQASAAIQNSITSTANIVIRQNAVAGGDIFRAARETGKNLSIRVDDSEGQQLYRWNFIGDRIEYPQVSMSLGFSLSTLDEYSHQVMQMVAPANAQGVVLAPAHSGLMPGPGTLTFSAKGWFEDGTKLNVYSFDDDTNEYSWEVRELTVQNGQLSLPITYGRRYLFTQAVFLSALPLPEEAPNYHESGVSTPAQTVL